MTEFIDKTNSLKKGKSTEFLQAITGSMSIDTAISKPEDFDTIELLSKGSDICYPFDLMLAKNKQNSILYLGHWNDGCL